jgi:hypothetical protein
VESTPTSRTWVRNDDQLSLNYFALAPDLSRPVGDDVALATHLQRGLPAQSLCLVEAKWTSGSQSVPMPRVTIKAAQEGSGMTYLGSLIVALARCSWVIEIQSEESGCTGLREAIWLEKYVSSGGTVEGLMSKGWEEEGVSVGPRRLASDDEEWDALVSEHPLSRARRHLSHLSSSLVRSADALRLATFR